MPAANTRVRLFVPDRNFFTFTDSNGEILLQNSTLGFNNSAFTFGVRVSPNDVEGYQGLDDGVLVTECDTDVLAEFELVPRVANLATVQGHVYDLENPGLPVPDAGLTITGLGGTIFDTSDENGAYLLEDILLGFDSQTTLTRNVHVNHPDYWGESESVTLNAGDSITLDFNMLRQRFGFIEGTVRDIATGQPVEEATFRISANFFLAGTAPTGPDGQYASSELPLNPGNQPRTYSYRVNAPGYWENLVTGVVVEADKTIEADVDLIRVCDGATIIGTVISAGDLQPIEDAKITRFGSPSASTFTDENGSFIFHNVTVGNDNTPLNVTIRAEKSGFFPQDKQVTVFCGASIQINFGDTSTSTSAIAGTVTDVDSGLPLSGVFVATKFGASTTTNAQGEYTFTDVPLGVNNSDRDWKVTAAPDAFPQQTKSVTAVADSTVTLDFDFDAGAIHPPQIEPIDVIEVEENATTEVIVTATDEDGDAITLSASLLPDFVTFVDNTDGTGTFTFVTDFDDAGDYPSATITAFDGVFTDTETFTIRVNNVNRGPTADANGPYEVNEGTAFNFDGSGSSDPDNNFLSYLWDVNNDGTFDIGGSQPSYTYLDDGTYTVLLKVDDNTDTANDSDTDTTTVVVHDQAPKASFNNTRFIGEGSPIPFFDHSTSPADEIVSWSWDFAGLGTSSEQNPQFIFAQDGNYSVTLVVTDDDGSTDDWTQFAQVLNVRPVVEAGEDQTVFEGAVVNLDPATFTDAGILDTHSATINWGDGTQIQQGVVTETNGSGSVADSHIYTQDGVFTVEVCVTDDSNGTGCDTFDVTVMPFNGPPEIATIDDVTMNEGEILIVQVSATDDEGDPITLDASNLPSFGVFNDAGNGNGTLTLSPGFDDAGTYPDAQITASDGNLSSAVLFSITVNDVNRPPVAEAGGPYSVNEGGILTLNGSASFDPDGNPLTYEWDFDGDSYFEVSPSIVVEDDFTGQAALTIDDGQESDSDNALVVVRNVAPLVILGPGAVFIEDASDVSAGLTFSSDGSFVDPGADTWQATVDYGDSSGEQLLSLNADKSFDLSHEYTEAGVFIVTVTITDDDSGRGVGRSGVVIISISSGIEIELTPGDQTIGVGEVGSFVVQVANMGTDTLNTVNVSSSETLDCGNFIGLLPAGESVSYQCVSIPSLEGFTGFVVVTGLTQNSGVVDTDSATVHVATVSNASVEITKSPDNQNVDSGSDALFTIRVENTGDAELTNVVVTDALTPDCDADLGTLASGEFVEYDCTAGVVASFVNEAIVIADSPDGPVQDEAQAAVTVEILTPTDANLSISKTASPNPAISGKTLVYTITVANAGPADATGVVVTDDLPDGVEFDAGASSSECAEAGGVVTCDVGDLPDGASADLTLVVRIPVTFTGTFTNTAEVSANEEDLSPADNSVAIETEVQLPVMELVNGFLNLDSLNTSYNPADGRAPAGVFTLTATWSNVSAVSLFDIHAEIAILTGENSVLNADDGVGVVGSKISVADDALGDDGILSPGESFAQIYEVGLSVPEQFTFFVNMFGRDP